MRDCRLPGSKSGSGRWSHSEEIGWVHSQEIGWSHSQEIRGVQSQEILQVNSRQSAGSFRTWRDFNASGPSNSSCSTPRLPVGSASRPAGD
jgi:hypothetical protein